MNIIYCGGKNRRRKQTEEIMKYRKSLNEMREGEKCVITDVKPSAMADRLKELGFTVGTSAKCLYRSFAGDPAAYSVKGTVIALRGDDAASILIRDCSFGA